MSSQMTAQLVTDALPMAIWRRGRVRALLLDAVSDCDVRAVEPVAGTNGFFFPYILRTAIRPFSRLPERALVSEH